MYMLRRWHLWWFYQTPRALESAHATLDRAFSGERRTSGIGYHALALRFCDILVRYARFAHRTRRASSAPAKKTPPVPRVLDVKIRQQEAVDTERTEKWFAFGTTTTGMASLRRGNGRSMCDDQTMSNDQSMSNTHGNEDREDHREEPRTTTLCGPTIRSFRLLDLTP